MSDLKTKDTGAKKCSLVRQTWLFFWFFFVCHSDQINDGRFCHKRKLLWNIMLSSFQNQLTSVRQNFLLRHKIHYFEYTVQRNHTCTGTHYNILHFCVNNQDLHSWVLYKPTISVRVLKQQTFFTKCTLFIHKIQVKVLGFGRVKKKKKKHTGHMGKRQ